MFKSKEIRRIAPLLIFFVVYTLVFWLWTKAFLYTLPFLIGGIIASAIQPLIKFFEKKLRFKHGISALVSTLLALILIIAAISFLSVYIVSEITALINSFSSKDYSQISAPITRIFDFIEKYFGKMDSSFFENNKEALLETIKNSSDLIMKMLMTILGAITSIPTIITMLFVSAFSSFFIAKDYCKIKAFIRGFLSEHTVFHIKFAAKHTSSASKKSMLSYLLIYFLTFCETLIITHILAVEYPFTVSIITAIADILPVLGPGIVLFPLAIYQLLIGAYSKAAGIVIGFFIITILREIMEPKLVASSTKIHPLVMLAAIYFSFVAKSFWVLIYMIGLFTLYLALKESGALPPLSSETKTENIAPQS